MKHKPMSITIGQIYDHKAIDELLAIMNGNNRGHLYDSIKDYMHYALSKKSKDFNPAAVDFLMNKTNINPTDGDRVADVIGYFLRITRSIFDMVRMHIRNAAGVSIDTYTLSHVIDYRRDTLHLEVVYA